MIRLLRPYIVLDNRATATRHAQAMIVWIVLAGVFLFALQYGHARYLEDQAAFNIDVLERFIQIYRQEYGRYPNYLWELPNFNVVSYKEGLALNFKDVRAGTWRGYRYDYVAAGMDQFVLSASPVGIYSGRLEFSVTEDGLLRTNDDKVDAAADTRDEVVQWEALERCPSIVSRVSPGK